MYYIYFGTTFGHAAELARRLADQLNGRGLDSTVDELCNISVQEIATKENVIIFCASFGQGDFPKKAEDFGNELLNERNAELFKNVKFSIFALGSTKYVNYARAGKILDQRFEALGGTRIHKVGLSNLLDVDGHETGYENWIYDFLNAIKAPNMINTTDNCKDQYEVEYCSNTNKQSDPCVFPNSEIIKIHKLHNITPLEYHTNVYHIELYVNNTSLSSYSIGDTVMLYPQNVNQQVNTFANYMEYNLDQNVIIQQTKDSKIDKNKASVLLNRNITIKQILTECLDIFGKPSYSFYEKIWKFCKTNEDKDKVTAILNNYNYYSQDLCINYFDLLQMVPSVKLTLAELIQFIPLIKAKSFSIASAPQYVSNNIIHLCVVIVKWFNINNEQKYGHASNFFKNLDQKDLSICSQLIPGLLKYPDDDMLPLIMLCTGTGIAPFRGFIEYRAWLIQNGKTVGDTLMYFGCRNSKADNLYQEELEAFKHNQVLTHLRIAFSRDQPEKKYIQDLMIEDSQLLRHSILRCRASVYICGASRTQSSVMKTLETILGEVEVSALLQSKRITSEVWG